MHRAVHHIPHVQKLNEIGATACPERRRYMVLSSSLAERRRQHAAVAACCWLLLVPSHASNSQLPSHLLARPTQPWLALLSSSSYLPASLAGRFGGVCASSSSSRPDSEPAAVSAADEAAGLLSVAAAASSSLLTGPCTHRPGCSPGWSLAAKWHHTLSRTVTTEHQHQCSSRSYQDALQSKQQGPDNALVATVVTQVITLPA